MAVARLRKVGGSTMVAIPPAMLEEAHLGPEGPVELSVEDGRILVDVNELTTSTTAG